MNDPSVKCLVREFEKNPGKWSTDDCIRIGDNLGLDRFQVRKWNWGYRRGLNLDTTRRNGQLKKSNPSKTLIDCEKQMTERAIDKLKDDTEVDMILSSLPK